eukprot:jgi/Tetstr1/439224/TSEL_027666.t1
MPTHAKALFRSQATNNHIRVHPEQPQGEDAFGYALADILNNFIERKHYDEAGEENQQNNKACGIIKHNSNAVKNLSTSTQALFPGDNVDEGSSPELPAKKAKQPANEPAAGTGLGRCWS